MVNDRLNLRDLAVRGIEQRVLLCAAKTSDQLADAGKVSCNSSEPNRVRRRAHFTREVRRLLIVGPCRLKCLLHHFKTGEHYRAQNLHIDHWSSMRRAQ